VNIKATSRPAQPTHRSSTSLSEEQTSESNEPSSADVRNPRKLSQFFPELTLTANAGR
jgi:glutamine amidotransferase